MNTEAAIAIAVGVVVVLGAISFFTLSRRSDVRGAGALSGETVQRDRSARRDAEPTAEQPETASDVEAAGLASRSTEVVKAEEPELVAWTPPDPEALGVSRRHFFNVASVTLMGAGLGAFAAAAFIGFLWPSGTGGFGGVVTVGKLGSIKDGIKQGGGFFYVPEARSWITAYPAESLPAAELVYPENVLSTMREGIVVLSQKCPHLGCRVPECQTSKWFECQCHGSQYNIAGEKKAGPAPRGMDHFPATLAANDDLTIDTGNVITGASIGTNTTGQEAEGPNCTGAEH